MRQRFGGWFVVASITAVALLAAGSADTREVPTEVREGRMVFAWNCSIYHTVGGGTRIGPDLAGVHERRDAEWLVEWISDPLGMVRTDPIARSLLAEWDNVQMADMGLTREEIDQVLAYIAYAGSTTEVDPAGEEMTEPREDDVLPAPPACPRRGGPPGVGGRQGGHHGHRHMHGQQGPGSAGKGRMECPRRQQAPADGPTCGCGGCRRDTR